MKKLNEQQQIEYWRFTALRQQARHAQLRALADYAIARAIGETLRRVWALPGARANANRVSRRTAPLLLREAEFIRRAVKAEREFQDTRPTARAQLEQLGR